MKKKTTFIKAITRTIATSETIMPWAKGARRAAFIAKRNAAAQNQGKAA